MNLCDTCAAAYCPERGVAEFCVQYEPHDTEACRAAQVHYAGMKSWPAWIQLCRLVEVEHEGPS